VSGQDSGKAPGNTLGYDSGKVPGSDLGKNRAQSQVKIQVSDQVRNCVRSYATW
jgi:hypothetical protein